MSSRRPTSRTGSCSAVDAALEGGPLRALPRDDQERQRVQVPPRARGVHEDVVATALFEGADGEDQGAVHRAQFGAGLVVEPVRFLLGGFGEAAAAGRGHRDRREAGVPRAPAAGPVDEVGRGAEDHGGGLGQRRSSSRRRWARARPRARGRAR